MKKKTLLFLPVLALTFFGGTLKANIKIGVVDFKKVVEKSKQGQQEKNAFEALKNQMMETLEKTDKELETLAEKLEDQDYMDGLSPAAEEELKLKFQQLSQEFARYQNQYYQMLNQANYRMLQSLHAVVAGAAEKVRKSKNLDAIFNQDSVFAFNELLNFTTDVIKQMDEGFDSEHQDNSLPEAEINS
ncbi:MAG: OmpH family outer membrane protein [Chlamydiia bacterium]|nr:OmpH family outer membrane protein [Chlamydiia bacterium]